MDLNMSDQFTAKDLIPIFQQQVANQATQTEILKQVTEISKSIASEVGNVKVLIGELKNQNVLKARDDESDTHRLHELIQEIASKQVEQPKGTSAIIFRVVETPGFWWTTATTLPTLIISLGGKGFVEAVGKIVGIIH